MGFLIVPTLNKLSIRLFCKESPKKIMKYLNVAEKNDAAKSIAAILSRGQSLRREGLSVYNKIYEFEARVRGQNCKMVMTSVSGHLLNYEFSIRFRGWNSCNPVSLFEAPVEKSCISTFVSIKNTLEREIVNCQGLIIWTDCDREGENIGFEIIQVCRNTKPNIRVYRAKFSEITAQSVFRALDTLGEPNKNVSDAVDVRQELDLRTGAAFTRLQTLRLQRVFPRFLTDRLISYGSCQFPTLGFVVDRYKAIEDFIAELFWRIKMCHTVKELTTEFSWKRDRLFDKNACEAILDVCKENPLATVESVEGKPKSKWRPLPLDTVEMEKNASKKLKITAKEAMTIAEKLYMQGFISYPRTETNIFPKELDLSRLVDFQTSDPNWGPFAHRIMNEGGPNPRQGKKSDQAHPPIHPIKYTNSLTGNEKRLYEYIVRHFLACVHKDAQGFETVVCVDIAGEKFTAKGLIILERNYLDVFIYENWNTKEINNYAQGDTFMPTVLEMTESKTTAPNLLTEAELIALMDKHGIGTDATHAEHIDTIIRREYAGCTDMYFRPGRLGMGLVEGYNNMELQVSLAKPVLRAEFEKDLKLICEGRKDADVVRREQIQKYKAVFETVMEKMQVIDESLAVRLEDTPQQLPHDVATDQGGNFGRVMKCSSCGKDMVLRDKRNDGGKFIGCCGYPGCKNAVWFPSSVEQVEILDQHCETCGPDVKKLKFKFRQNPFPGEPNPNVLCVGGCDLDLLQLFSQQPSIRRDDRSNSSSLNRSQANPTILSSSNNTNQRIGDVNNRRTNPNWDSSNVNNRANTFNNGTNVSTLTGPNNFRNNNQWGGNTNSSTTDWGQNTEDSDNNRRNSWNSRDFTNSAVTSSPQDSSWPNNRTGDNTNRDNNIVCGCDNEAVLLTVRKEGPNTGRQFYKCASQTCNFFLWASEPPSNMTHDTSQNNMSRRDNELRCNCGLPAVQRTVSKAGPNTGRTFYACPKAMGQGCNFFKWCDEPTNTNTGGDDFGGGGGGGGAGNLSSWKGKSKAKPKNNSRTMPYPKSQTRAKRKCGICGEEGHTRAKCPNK